MFGFRRALTVDDAEKMGGWDDRRKLYDVLRLQHRTLSQRAEGKSAEVYRDPTSRRVFVLGYDAARLVLENDNLFHTEGGYASKTENDFKPRDARDIFQRMMLLSKGLNHRRRSSAGRSVFGQRAVSEARPEIQHAARRAFVLATRGGQLDVGRLAHSLPITVISDILGVPERDRAKIQKWASAITNYPETPGYQYARRSFALLRASRAGMEMDRYFKDLFTRPGQKPGTRVLKDAADLSPLVVEMTRGRRQGPLAGSGELSIQEIVSNLMVMIVAGHHTTTNQLGSLAVALCRDNRRVLKALRDNPELVESIVEESLRMDGSVQATPRVYVGEESIEVGGVRIQKGDKIGVVVGAANTDPTKYADPLAFRPDRFMPGHTEPQNIAFGAGEHTCIGFMYAKAQLIAFANLLVEYGAGPLDKLPHAVGGRIFRGAEGFPLPLEHEPEFVLSLVSDGIEWVI